MGLYSLFVLLGLHLTAKVEQYAVVDSVIMEVVNVILGVVTLNEGRRGREQGQQILYLISRGVSYLREYCVCLFVL